VARPTSEIASHIASVQHRTLCEKLHHIGTLIHAALPPADARTDGQAALAATFDELVQEAKYCFQFEAKTVLPDSRPAGHADASARALLERAIRTVERSHARSMRRIWKVLDFARTCGASKAGKLLVSELSEFAEAFFRYLYEEECVLLPRIVADLSTPEAEPPPARRTGLPRP
jgi:hypothetical protein